MKRLLYAVPLLLGLSVVAVSSLEARVNALDPWAPGQDMAVGQVGSYNAYVPFIAGEKLYEVPAVFSYVTAPGLEIGARWGIKSDNSNAGINDLLFGAKYQLVAEDKVKPGILAEAAVSLPTGDSSKDLGTGAPALLLHWSIAKQIEEVKGLFGLGIRVNGENSDDVRQGSVFYYHAGAIFPGKYIDLSAELKGFNHGKLRVNNSNIDDSDYQELYLAPGAEYRIDDLHALQGSLLIGLTQKSSDLGLYVSMSF